MTEKNVIPFPLTQARQCDEDQLSNLPPDVLRIDLLSIANYLHRCATWTDRPLWMESMAHEVKRVASEVGKGNH